MSDHAIRADALRHLTSSPVASAFLLLADHNDLTIAEIVDPWTTHFLVREAVCASFFIEPGDPWVTSVMTRDGGRLAALAAELLHHPNTRWWTGFDLAMEQLHMDIAVGEGLAVNLPPNLEQTFAAAQTMPAMLEHALAGQYPPDQFITSTATREGWSGEFTEYALPPGDFLYQAPTDRWTFQVELTPDGPGVIHINSKWDWHRFCASFPLTRDDGQTIPDWETAKLGVAGVHVTILGLLTFGDGKVSEGGKVTRVPAWIENEFTWWPNASQDLTHVRRLQRLEGAWDMPKPPVRTIDVPELDALYEAWSAQNVKD